jgi:cellulose synthase/poly-beta-1,6-N-acetylglucosamine synthase-like glycosyltransferase
VPSDLGSLRRQRNRWHRGLWTNLWRHRGMFLDRRYGRVGMLAVPFFWVFEGLAPVVEVTGYVSLLLSALMGALEPGLLWLFLGLSLLHGLLLSQLAIGVEAMLLHRYPKNTDRLVLLAACFLELVWFHQVLVLERCRATFQALSGRGGWGAMRRVGIS